MLFFTTETLESEVIDIYFFKGGNAREAVHPEGTILLDPQRVGRLHSSRKILNLASLKLLGKRFSRGKKQTELIRLSTAKQYLGYGMEQPEEQVLFLIIGYPSVGLAEWLGIGHIRGSFWEAQPSMTKDITRG